LGYRLALGVATSIFFPCALLSWDRLSSLSNM
jgi:hypothetical protein